MDIAGYRKTVLATTDRVQIILMLFEGVLNHLRIAKRKMENRDIMSKGVHISKATLIVTELSNVLDMEKGGEIASNLRNLYNFVLQRLLQANANNDINAIEDAEKVIDTLREGWKEMMKEVRQNVKVGV
ncbi:MAG: flagellar export chaperone FliS [Nitrospiraceae bacterium]|nr:MAG: flagellar export chaperone FliS [Nitrospiraceae bacterium]